MGIIIPDTVIYTVNFEIENAADYICARLSGTGNPSDTYHLSYCYLSYGGQTKIVTFSGQTSIEIGANEVFSDYVYLPVPAGAIVKMTFKVSGTLPEGDTTYNDPETEEPVITNGGDIITYTPPSYTDLAYAYIEFPLNRMLFNSSTSTSSYWVGPVDAVVALDGLSITQSGTIYNQYYHDSYPGVLLGNFITGDFSIELELEKLDDIYSFTFDILLINPSDFYNSYLRCTFGDQSSFFGSYVEVVSRARTYSSNTIDLDPTIVTSCKMRISRVGSSLLFEAAINGGSYFTALSKSVTVVDPYSVRFSITGYVPPEIPAGTLLVKIKQFDVYSANEISAYDLSTYSLVSTPPPTIGELISGGTGGFGYITISDMLLVGSGTRFLGQNQGHMALISMIIGAYQSNNDRSDLEWLFLEVSSDARYIITDISIPMLSCGGGDNDWGSIDIPLLEISVTASYSYGIVLFRPSFLGKSFIQGLPAEMDNSIKPRILLMDHPDIVELSDALFWGM